ncbi:MAG: hypothetical protein COZ96_07570 [Nitrospirae bacterium CG_4_8_14_3_um_filter_70_85]|nr:SDR family NAD(P)-dependent oxidoreductase [Deltaproteobacteria bacterium]PIU78662.1 MAG: hypothetical protein COS73_06485 [Nitrospirae bacterium CG06_land_8_20_14_3_00_70_43]PIW82654.1 MAG: hypothetical protein COZ96_07570 [Nitrospirae bacterium CG_4_8_14_3_um_filter_70_85]PIX83956.1 MAG: hypothetical protein COZ33_02740 [Nitrospirae bacterium CG_4_10_14_3_um_filter_70_108]PJB94686.1 MAG: hypothetical protein CO080_11635 [Nitrospirae bacterium CG_4_9_14_0_8_um_filter_70_14]
MDLHDARILLTGAAGNIGQALARALAGRGARLALVDRNGAALEALAAEIGDPAGRAFPIAADLLDPGDRADVVATARARQSSGTQADRPRGIGGGEVRPAPAPRRGATAHPHPLPTARCAALRRPSQAALHS